MLTILFKEFNCIFQTARCLKYEFDSTYPISLNSIINPYVFRQSSEKIKRSIGSRAPSLFIVVAMITFCIESDIVSFVVGAIIKPNAHNNSSTCFLSMLAEIEKY